MKLKQLCHLLLLSITYHVMIGKGKDCIYGKEMEAQIT